MENKEIFQNIRENIFRFTHFDINFLSQEDLDIEKLMKITQDLIKITQQLDEFIDNGNN